MKKTLLIVFLLSLVISTVYFQKDIVNYILGFTDNIELEEKSTIIESNEYKSVFEYKYIQNTYVYNPSSKEELKKIYYSFINSGMEEITIYCDKNYESCLNDAGIISKDNLFLNTLNNYVHPYNSYKYIETKIYNNRIVITLTHAYNKQMINEINNKIDEIINNIITNNMSTEEKIRKVHDYIINNTKYDSNKSDNSTLAYSTLFDGISTCNGYTDLMSIFLYKLNIPNYKISTDKHIWNLAKVNDKWLHIDLTWDDPMTSTNQDILLHDYFLITDEKLKKLDPEQHNYDYNVYIEAKN